MKEAGLYSIMIEAINRFMEEQIPQTYPHSEYGLFYYAGALLNIFIKWEADNHRLSAEEAAQIICRLVPQKAWIDTAHSEVYYEKYQTAEIRRKTI